MSDMQQPQPASLAAALRNRKPAAPARPALAPRPAPAAPEPEVTAPVLAEPTVVEVMPEAAPALFDASALAALGEALLTRMEHTISSVLGGKVSELTQEAKTAERAQGRLDDALSRATRANPETIAMLEAEDKRKLMEIQRLQSELERTRTAMRQVIGGGQRSFYRSLGKNLGNAATECFDLLDVAPFLAEGKITPEVGKRIAAHLRATGRELEEFADNCAAYAEDDSE